MERIHLWRTFIMENEDAGAKPGKHIPPKKPGGQIVRIKRMVKKQPKRKENNGNGEVIIQLLSAIAPLVFNLVHKFIQMRQKKQHKRKGK
jgi:hypothetical protein